MKIIEPKVELWRQEDAKAHVARCARVCYGKETGNDEATVKRLYSFIWIFESLLSYCLFNS